MKHSQPRQSFFLNFILIIGIVMIWITFAPANIGGSASYLMVNGISMEPNYHTGDLVIVRKAPAYQIGDVVTYRDAEMGAYVIHRIINVEQGKFIIKGDNNSWVDAYHPTYDEMIGKQWIHVPKAGRITQWFRKPINLSLSIFLLGGVLMSSTIIKPSKAKNGKRSTLPAMGGMFEGVLYLLGVLLFGFIALSIFAFMRPLSRTADNIQYQQEGGYSYSATATPGVYDGEVVQSGEPIFPKLTCFMNLGFAYNIPGGPLQNVSGNYQMIARVADPQSGWQRTIPLASQTSFTGNSFLAAAPLDLCQLTTLMNMVETETGLRANTYLVEIVTNIAFTADASGRSITDTFTPALAFKFDKVHLYLANTNAEIDSMHMIKEGIANSNALQINTLSIFGLHPSIYTIRILALFGLGFSFLGLCILGAGLMHASQDGEDALIRLKYGNTLMDVYEQNLSPTSATINVTSIDNLAKLAERQGTMILHMIYNNLHTYLVQGNGVTYRYAVNSTNNIEVEPTDEVTKPKIAWNEKPLLPHKLEPQLVVNTPSKHQTYEHIPVRQQSLVEGNKPVKNDPQAAWIKIQREAQAYLESHPANKKAPASGLTRRGKTTEYIIQTGEIGFHETEPARKVILNKIKI